MMDGHSHVMVAVVCIAPACAFDISAELLKKPNKGQISVSETGETENLRVGL
jgi:hypothetical protein